MWAGSDDGVVSVTQDAGKTWTNVTPNISGVPKWTYVADVAAVAARRRHRLCRVRRPSRRRLQHLRVHDHRLRRDVAIDRRQPAAGRSRARDLAEDRKNADILYLGTETGLWVSWNNGRPVDAPQGQPADDADLRDQAASARQRSDPRHACARHLDSRRSRHRSSSGASPSADAFLFSPSRRRS